MENLSPEYLFRAEVWLLITSIIYIIMNGAGLFETAVIVPKWTKNPPDSLQIFRGEYGIDLKTFWIVVHSVHEITFIVAIVFCWNIPGVREAMLTLFGAHFAIRVWTLLYFVPNIMEFQKIANAGGEVANLEQRVSSWRRWNYFRMLLFVLVNGGVCWVVLALSQTMM